MFVNVSGAQTPKNTAPDIKWDKNLPTTPTNKPRGRANIGFNTFLNNPPAIPTNPKAIT